MFKTLRVRLALIFIALAILPVVVVSVVLGNNEVQRLQDAALDTQVTESRLAGLQISAFIAQRENELHMIGQVRRLSILSPEEQNVVLGSLMTYDIAFQELVLMDNSGQEVVHLSRNTVYTSDKLLNRATAPEFSIPFETGNVYYSRVRFDERLREPLVDIAVPVYDISTRSPSHVLLAQFRFRPIWELMTQLERLGSSNSSNQIYVIDEFGGLVAHQNPSLVLSGTTVKLPPRDGLAIGIDGNDVILARETLQFGDQKLIVVAERDVSDALAPVQDFVRIAAIITGLALLFAVISIVFTVLRVVRPIVTLSAAAKRISDGDLASRANIKSQTEIGELGESFNKMADQVQDLVNNLELRVAERTREAEEARETAEKANLIKSQFLANMSHELRTPLNAILNFTAFVADGVLGPVNEEQHEALNQSLTSSKHLLSLINDVLDITKIEAGLMDLFIQEIDMNEILGAIVSVGKGLVKDKEIILETNIEEALPRSYGDKRRMRQVFLNLISNAIKFTAAGSVTITATHQAKTIHVSVKDTGIGISAEDKARVFEVFKQAQQNSLPETVGTGLGMPISKFFVESHGGRIWFESEVGVGTTFYVELPILTEAEADTIRRDAMPVA